jgi:hypothetical protein
VIRAEGPFPSEDLCVGFQGFRFRVCAERVASAPARSASDSNFDRISLYLHRMPTEFRVLSVRDASLSTPAIRSTAAYTKWAVENHHVLA